MHGQILFKKIFFFKETISFHFTYKSQFPLPPVLLFIPPSPSHTPIHYPEWVRHIYLGKTQGRPYYV